MILDFIIKPVSDVVNTVLKRVLPAEKMSEEQAAKLTHEIQLELIKQNWAGVEKQYEDLASARNLAAQDVAKGNAFTNVLAASIRPAFGYGCLVAFLWSVFGSYAGLTPLALDVHQTDIMLRVIEFYFGARTFEKAMNMYSNMKAKQ